MQLNDPKAALYRSKSVLMCCFRDTMTAIVIGVSVLIQLPCACLPEAPHCSHVFNDN
jgi:hypothetical protein